MRNTKIVYASTEKTPTVLTEMEGLLPPLTEEQLSALEEDIVRNGSYSPIVVNQDMVVIDGHNRLKVCQKHGLPYRMAVFEFDDLLEAKQWALEAQKARRNLDRWELGKIALKLKPELTARAKANMSIGGSKKKSVPGQSAAVEQNSAPERESAGETKGLCVPATLVAERVNTRQKMAEAVGLSADMMGKIMKIEESAPAVIKEALDRKEISINQAYIATKYVLMSPEEEREKQTLLALELVKAHKEIQKGDGEINRRTKMAGLFIKAFASCVHLRPTVENVACWVDCCRMTRMAIKNAASEAKEYSEVFAAIAEILQQFLEAGVGADALTVLSGKRDADCASLKKEEDRTA